MNGDSLIIKWDEEAWLGLQKALEFIKEKSFRNAEKVSDEILKKISTIPEYPTKFGLDKLKNNNDGSYRYFELHHLRIAFRITEKEIKILRIRSTHQEPLSY